MTFHCYVTVRFQRSCMRALREWKSCPSTMAQGRSVWSHMVPPEAAHPGICSYPPVLDPSDLASKPITIGCEVALPPPVVTGRGPRDGT